MMKMKKKPPRKPQFLLICDQETNINETEMTVKQCEEVGNRRSQELKWLSKDSTVEKSKVATIAFRYFKMLGPMFFVDQALFVMNCSYDIDIMPAGSFMAAMRTRVGHQTRLVRNWFHPAVERVECVQNCG